MDTLQRTLDDALKDMPRQALISLLRKKLNEQGITTSKSQLDQLASHVLSGAPAAFRIRKWRWWEEQEILLELTEEDADALEKSFEAFLENHLPALISSLSAEIYPHVLTTLRKKWPRQCLTEHRMRARFRKGLLRRWGTPLDQVMMLLSIATEYGAVVNERARTGTENSAPYLTDVLTRLHARGCQVTEEIICLLNAGLADGAMARWRTLHEIAVVALLLSHFGEELAERYVEHQAVEAYTAANLYQKHCGTLGQPPLSSEELAAILEAYQAVGEKYGAGFLTQYGWAAHHLAMRRPTFADLETASEIDHLRPYYKMASHNVHANPNGVYFKLGLLPERDFLLAGPSDIGLAEPGHSAAISLLQISASLCQLKPTLDDIVTLRIMAELCEETGRSFGSGHTQQEAAERHAHKAER